MTGEPQLRTASALIDAIALGLHKTRAGNDSPEYDMEKADERAEAIWDYVRPVFERHGAEARAAALADAREAVAAKLRARHLNPTRAIGIRDAYAIIDALIENEPAAIKELENR